MSLNLKGFVIFSRGLSGGVSPDHRIKKNKKNLKKNKKILKIISRSQVQKNKKILKVIHRS